MEDIAGLFQAVSRIMSSGSRTICSTFFDLSFIWSKRISPAVLAAGGWDPDAVREDLRRNLGILRGRHVEIVMKDISTVKYQPKRLWDWVRIATEVAAED